MSFIYFRFSSVISISSSDKRNEERRKQHNHLILVSIASMA